MTKNLKNKETGENDLIGNILDDGTDDFFMIRQAMGKSISAPPPGLQESLLSQSPDITKDKNQTFYSTQEYYDYYHSLKPHDPRLPLPKWKPPFVDQNLYSQFQNTEDDNGFFDKGQKIVKGGNENTSMNSKFSQVTVSSKKEQIMSTQSDANYEISTTMSKNTYFKQNISNSQEQFYPQEQEEQIMYKPKPISTKNTYSNQSISNQQFYQQQNNQNYQSNNYQFNPYSQQQQFQQQFQPTYSQQYQQYNYQQQSYYPQKSFKQNQHQQYQQNQNFYNDFQQQQPSQMYNMHTNFNPMSSYLSPQTQMGGYNQVYLNNNPQYFNYYNAPNQNQNQGGYMDYGSSGGYQQQNMGNSYQNNMGKGGKGFQKNNNHQNLNASKMDIKYVLAHIVEGCRDQNGSRLIQLHFEKAGSDERESIFQQILPNAYGLMTDVFGNYVIQRILELGSFEQKVKIFETTKDKIYELSQHTYGCRVVQRALEEFKNKPDYQKAILAEIKDDIVPLIEDQNGNHVVQKCFETIPTENLQFIIDEVVDKISSLAFHAYGCRVIQRILEYCPIESTFPMLKKLMHNAIQCCQCQYGNYIMQYILEKGPKNEREALFEIVKNNFTKLSINKFASNVTERSAVYGSNDFREGVINILLNSYHDSKLSLVFLMNHPYGNYVVQRLFECSTEDLRVMIYQKILKENVMDEIKRNNYGKHVMAFIEKLMH